MLGKRSSKAYLFALRPWMMDPTYSMTYNREILLHHHYTAWLNIIVESIWIFPLCWLYVKSELQIFRSVILRRLKLWSSQYWKVELIAYEDGSQDSAFWYSFQLKHAFWSPSYALMPLLLASIMHGPQSHVYIGTSHCSQTLVVRNAAVRCHGDGDWISQARRRCCDSEEAVCNAGEADMHQQWGGQHGDRGTCCHSLQGNYPERPNTPSS